MHGQGREEKCMFRRVRPSCDEGERVPGTAAEPHPSVGRRGPVPRDVLVLRVRRQRDVHVHELAGI